MWPKALTQLIDLAPHISRLVPMADRFIQSHSNGNGEYRSALESATEGLREELGQVTSSQAGIYRQLNDQNRRLDEMTTAIDAARAAAESNNAHILKLEHRLSGNTVLLAVSVMSNIVLLGLVIVVVLHR